jgi:hypothetical protein
MLLLGCILALGIAVAPRAVLIVAWIFSDRWVAVWHGAWIVPLLGIIFLPYTTIMYMLSLRPGGPVGTDWLWILLGLFLDLTNYAQAGVNRERIPGYEQTVNAVGRSGGSGTTTAGRG